MKRRMVKRLRQLNSTGPHELFGATQQPLDTCCEGPAAPRLAGRSRHPLP